MRQGCPGAARSTQSLRRPLHPTVDGGGHGRETVQACHHVTDCQAFRCHVDVFPFTVPYGAPERHAAVMQETRGMRDVVRLYSEGDEGVVVGLTLKRAIGGYELRRDEMHMEIRWRTLDASV